MQLKESGSLKISQSMGCDADSLDCSDNMRLSRRSDEPGSSVKAELQNSVDHTAKQELGSNGQTLVQRKHATNGSVS